MSGGRAEAGEDPTRSEGRRLVGLSIAVSDEENVDVPALMRKMHRRVLPVCLLILFFSNIDRGNLGFVANQLCRDLKLTHTEYGTGASAFFLGFFFSRIPSNIALKRFGAPLWLMTIMFSWGVLAAALSLMTNVYHFYILRFLLGVAEGGAFPGVWFYLTEFFPDDHLTFPYAIIATAAPVATAASGPLAAFFVSLDGLQGVAAWRYLFFFEGAVPALAAPIMYFFLPKSINSSNFLTTDERIWVKRKMDSTADDMQQTFVEEFKALARTLYFWILNITGIIHLGLFAVIMYWTTLMIEEILTDEDEKEEGTCASSHSTGLASILMTAFVFSLSSLLTFVVGIVAEKRTDRHVLAGLLTGLCGLALISWPVTDYKYDELGLVSLTLAACAMNAPTGLIAGLLVSRYDARLKATALSVYSTVATVGGLLGPIMTGAIVDHYDNYNVASVVLGIFGLFGGVLFFTITDPLQQKDADDKHSCEEAIDPVGGQ